MTELSGEFPEKFEPDSVDWAILGILQNDASTPNKDIAAKVGLAPSSCLERIRRLRQAGVVSSVRAQVDPARLGRSEQAFLGIQVRPHSRETATVFVAAVTAMPEVLAVYNVSGAEDYLVHVAVKNSAALQTLIIDHILALPQVAHCRTQLIFGEPLIGTVRPTTPPAGKTRRA